MLIDTDMLMTPKKAAQYMGRKSSTIGTHIKNKSIKTIEISGVRFIHKDEADAWLLAHGMEAKQGRPSVKDKADSA